MEPFDGRNYDLLTMPSSVPLSFSYAGSQNQLDDF